MCVGRHEDNCAARPNGLVVSSSVAKVAIWKAHWGLAGYDAMGSNAPEASCAPFRRRGGDCGLHNSGFQQSARFLCKAARKHQGGGRILQCSRDTRKNPPPQKRDNERGSGGRLAQAVKIFSDVAHSISKIAFGWSHVSTRNGENTPHPQQQVPPPATFVIRKSLHSLHGRPETCHVCEVLWPHALLQKGSQYLTRGPQ